MPKSKILNPKSEMTPSAAPPPLGPLAPELLPEQPSLQAEIDVLRRHMAWIQSAFERARSFDNRLKLAGAWGDASAHLARLLRVQRQLQSGQPDPLGQFMASLIKEINQEWEAQAAGQLPSTPEELLVAAGDAARRASAIDNSGFPAIRSLKGN